CTSDERQAMDRIRCVPQNCADNEYRNAAEECATCGPQNGINPAENGCIQCTNDLIEHPVTDRCVCPNGEQLMQGTTDMCEPIPCNADQILSGGMCRDCTGDTKPNMGKSICVPNNCANNEIRAADETCRAAAAGDCPVEDEIPQPQNGLRNCTACSDINQNQPEQNSDGLSCRATTASDCGGGEVFVNNGCEMAADCSADGARNSVLDSVNNGCICPAEMPQLFNDGGGGNGFCAESLPVANVRYSVANCIGAEWTAMTLFNGDFVRETCEIPVVISTRILRQAAALRPLQVVAGDMPNNCILRQHGNYPADGTPQCVDENLFGTYGLPRQPATFDATQDRLTLFAATGNAEREIEWNNLPVARFSVGGVGGDSKNGEIAMAAGAAAFVGLLVWTYWDGNLAAFSLSPQTSFSHNGGAAAYSYGSRLDFRQDDLSAYWGASQSHAGGETDGWIYFTGMEYGKDFWNISYNSESQGVRTRMDLAAGAEWQRGILSYKTGVATVYNIAEAGEDFTASWRNSLEL
ncbi:MAG: hypothetical protein HAW59_07150, partial [Betaproteobacteria bacterium]|nr:hypothetical protein [Betaproteobacteria bacterium]